MKSQKGYIDIHFRAVIIELLIVGAVIGAVLAYVIPWLWDYIKPIIHALTA